MKRFVAFAMVIGLAAAGWAAGSEGNARAAAGRWGGHRRGFGGRRGATIERVTRHAPADGGEFFAVKFAGGGTAFVAGEGTDEMPIAFTSSTNDFSAIDRGSALWALLERDAKVRKLAGLSRSVKAAGGASIDSESGISDLRVAPLVRSRWNQGDSIYNLYTPKNYICGCVATAVAQVMRYFKFPAAARSQLTRRCYVDGTATSLTMQGGTYDWEQMPLAPTADSPLEERQAISKLTSDVGIAVCMQYTSDGSGAYTCDATDALTVAFGYGSAVYCEVANLDEILSTAIIPNLAAGYPVILGVSKNSSENGHCIVGDGYGYEGGLTYVHLNMGWSGEYDLWYNLPNIGGQYGLNVVDEIVANVFPTNALGSVIVSGRVTDGTAAVPQAKVTVWSAVDAKVAETRANDYGVWGVVVAGGDYRLVAENPAGTVTVTSEVSVASQRYQIYDNSYNDDSDQDVWADGGFSNLGGNTIVLRNPRTVRVAADGSGDYTTISNAVREAASGDVILVAPGTYRGCVEVPSGVRVTVISTDGPEATTIMVPTEELNCCFYAYESPDSLISGFTLTNGWDYYGGGVFGGIASNCIIRNCTAYNGGGGAAVADLTDCTIRDCSAYYGGGAYQSTLVDCVIAGCEADLQGGGASVATLVNCTVRGNRAWTYRTSQGRNYSRYVGGGLDCDCLCTNTVVWGNFGPSGSTDDWEWYRERYWHTCYRQWMLADYAPSFLWCCTSDQILWGENSITNDPKFVSEDILDPLVYDCSPCIGAGYAGENIGAYRGSGKATVLPEIDVATVTGVEVSNAVASVGYADEEVAEGIGTNAETYVEFQTWSTNGLASDEVLLSPHAYDSFCVRDIVAAPTLLEAESQLVVTNVAAAAAGELKATVELVDGMTAVPLRAAKEAFAERMFVGTEITGMARAQAEQVTAEETADGKSVELTIAPPPDAGRYFMRLDFRGREE